jgi:hypothetical protein
MATNKPAQPLRYSGYGFETKDGVVTPILSADTSEGHRRQVLFTVGNLDRIEQWIEMCRSAQNKEDLRSNSA